jgi:hypothetical protein
MQFWDPLSRIMQFLDPLSGISKFLDSCLEFGVSFVTYSTFKFQLTLLSVPYLPTVIVFYFNFLKHLSLQKNSVIDLNFVIYSL